VERVRRPATTLTLLRARCKHVVLMKKVITFISCLLLAGLCSAQADSLGVSIFLSEAEVVSISIDRDTPFVERPDSLMNLAMPAVSLSEILLQFTSVRMRTYGPKGTLVSGIGNGLSSDHMAVLWNGVPINSPSLGSSDLGNIPASMFSSLEYLRGNEVSRISSGTGAGVIQLFSKGTKDNSFSAGYDNLGNARTSLKIGVKPTQRLQLVSTLQLDRALNEFQYVDPLLLNRKVRKQNHNNYNRLSFIQSAFITAGENLKLDASIWLQRSDLNLPEILGSYGSSFANQRDSSFRTNIGAVFTKKEWIFQLRSAFLSDGQHYKDFNNPEQAPIINSEIQTVRWFHQASASWQRSGSKVEFALTKQDEFARTENYDSGNTLRVIHGVQVHAKKQVENIIFSGGMRYDIGTVGGIPIPNVRIAFQKKNAHFFVSYNRSFRYADLNELYWRPGGSSSLNPEQGNMFDLGYALSKQMGGSVLSVSSRVFYQKMDELILWVNVNNEYQAQNISNTESFGLEGKVEHAFSIGKMNLKQLVNVSYQDQTGLSEIENAFFFDLMGRYSLQMHSKKVFAGINARYSAPTLNSGSLNRIRGNQEQLLLFDSFVGTNFEVRKSTLSMSVSCMNIADIMDYRNTNVASPGRVLSINLVWKWNTDK
jgi:vitamin B12 transporter